VKLAVITFGDENYKKWNKFSFPNKARYCQLHKYDFFPESVSLSERPPTWNKMLYIKKYLCSYEWVFWTDADSLIMNYERRLESFLLEHRNLIVCRDENGINAGQMFFRNTDWSLRLLNDTLSQKHFLSDQEALIYVLENRDRRDLDKVEVRPQNAFNSYKHTYREGDFLIHFPGAYKDYWLFKYMSYRRMHMDKWKIYLGRGGWLV
jgi:hypothetical protein